jgi:8-oxo-dGTP pyrophosphatase MutT (NUDIX family)
MRAQTWRSWRVTWRPPQASLHGVSRRFDFDWFQIRWLPRYGWVLRRSPAVVVIAVAPDSRLWLVRVRRPPTNTTFWEIPGGGIEKGEDTVSAALRELEEECGLVSRGRSWALRPVLEPAPGMGTFPHHVVVASGVVPKGKKAVAQREEGILSVRSFDRDRVDRMVRAGRICVQATLAALLVSGWLHSRTKSVQFVSANRPAGDRKRRASIRAVRTM